MATGQDVRWLSLEAWDRCGEPIDIECLRGRPCFAGLDLSTTTDVTALVLAFKLDDDVVAIVPRFWIPSDNARMRDRRDRVPYETWARQGYLEMTPGNVVDYERIRATINGLRSVFDIREIAVDRWNATHLATLLEQDGFELVAFGQGFKDMTAPAKELEKLILSGKLRHGAHPVLR